MNPETGPARGVRCNWIAILLAASLVAACGGGSDGPPKHAVSVRVDSPVGSGESFRFSLNAESVTISQTNLATAFATALAEGSAYAVNQTFGPRTCSLTSARGTVGSADVLVKADCGTATPKHTVSVRIASPVGSGESFQFSLNGEGITIGQANVATAFATALDEGSAYTVNQTFGPRACNLAGAVGTIGTADVLVTAECGTPPGNSALIGELRAPVGTAVTLRNNGLDDLALTLPPPAGSSDLYDALPFTFATALAGGTAYAVTVAQKPVNQTCRVYKGASGNVPVAANALKVGCEFTDDLVSRSTDNAVRGSYFDSSAPSIGGAGVAVGNTGAGYGEGRFVAFVSYAAGMGGASGAKRQILWRDRLTGATRLISTDSAGAEGNGDSFAPAISADGLTVAFESYATNLVAGDTNGVRDVFVWSAAGGVLPTGVQRVNVGAGGAQANGESFEPAVSGDGRVVAFSTSASNLTTGVSGTSTVNVVRRDLDAGTNTLISANASNVGVGGRAPALSEDGNRLAFWSFSSQIVAGDNNGLWDIFVYQRDNGTVRRVSLTETGGERDQGNESTSRVVAPAISGNGRFVAYATTATNVVAGDTNAAQDVFVVDLDAGLVVRRASVGSGGAQANGDSPVGQGERVALSYDGTWVAFGTAASNLGVPANNVVIHNLVTGETRAVSSQVGGTGPATMSRSGAYVAFGAAAALDDRFAGSGLFAHFTDVDRAWWWID